MIYEYFIVFIGAGITVYGFAIREIVTGDKGSRFIVFLYSFNVHNVHFSNSCISKIIMINRNVY